MNRPVGGLPKTMVCLSGVSRSFQHCLYEGEVHNSVGGHLYANTSVPLGALLFMIENHSGQ